MLFMRKFESVQRKETVIVISNWTHAASDFEITRLISDQIVLHSVQLPLLIRLSTIYGTHVLIIFLDKFTRTW